MAERATKRRSARQLAGRKRSIYYDPESEDELFNFRDDAEEDQESQPEPLPEPSQSQRPKKKRKVHNPPRRQTRLKVKAKERWLSSGKGRRKDGKPRKKKHRVVKTLISPSKRKAANMVFTGPSDEVKPAWTSLPIEILRDIFIFASQPMQEYTITASANVSWLIKAARSCRAFAVPALEAYYQSPSLLNSVAPHLLLELLQIPKAKLYMNYSVKIRRLEIDIRPLSYSAHNRGLFDLAALVRNLPQLQHLEIMHPVDTPPYRPMKIQSWLKPPDLFTAVRDSGALLKSFRWNRDMMHLSFIHQGLYDLMTRIHTSSGFEYLERLVVCGFDVNNSTEQRAEEGSTARPPGLALAISTIQRLRDLTFISCDLIMEDFLEHLPKNLQRLEMNNCLEVTSDMLNSYLATGGSQLRELVLNHNPALNLSFLQNLKALCPRLEVLKMDLTYYSERFNYNDAWAIYDGLLTVDEIPTWPSTLRHLELHNLKKWEAEAAQNLFRSLVEGAKDLPDLRHLVVQAHISIPWRDRAQFRDQWIERLEKVYLRKIEDPNPNMGSLKQFRLWKAAQANSKTSIDTSTKSAESRGFESDYEDGQTRRKLSHVRITPRKAPPDAELYSEIEPTPEKRRRGPPRRSVRVAESQSTASTVAEDSSSEESDDNAGDWQQEQPEAFVQGMCKVVDIRIDNQRPRENQYTEANFLDSEPSGDEDWHSGAEISDDGYAW